MYNGVSINMREKDINLISEAYSSMYEPNEPAQFKIGDNVKVNEEKPIQTEAYKDINRSPSDIYNMQDNRQDFRDWLEDYGIEPDEEGIYNIDDFKGFGYSNENRVKALFDKDQVNLLFVPEKGLGGKPARNTFNRFDTENIIDWVENYISIN